MKKFAVLLIVISFLFGIILNCDLFTKDNQEIQIAELKAFADMPIEDYFMNGTPNNCWLCTPDDGWCDISAQCCLYQWPYCD